MMLLLRRAPVTTGLLLVVVTLGAVRTGLAGGRVPGLRAAVGLGVPSLASGRWWTLLSGVIWCAGPLAYLGTAVLLVALVAPAEYRIGSRATAVLLGLTHVLGGGLGVGLVALAATTGDWARRLGSELAVGPSTAAVGLVLAASTHLDALWRRRVRTGLPVILIMLALYSGSLQDILRLCAGLVGLVLGPLLLGRPRARPQLVVSGPETRILVALLVAASAVGPLIAVVSGTATGPLSVLRFLLLPPPPDPAAVAAVCADPATSTDDCVSLLYRLRLGGLAPAVLSVLPVALLLVLADGLRRGRRFALHATAALNGGFALLGMALAVLTAATPAERIVAFGGAGDRQFYTGVITSIAQPLAIVALLYATRTRFQVRAPARAYRRPALFTAATLATLSVIYLAGGAALRAQFSPAPGEIDLLADLPTRFAPPGYLGEVEIGFLPITPAASVLYEWTGVLFWIVALGAVMWVLRRTRTVTGDAHTARALLIRHGGSTLSWQSTWAGNSYWFDPTRRAAIAYRVIGRVALSTGEPFGQPDARAAVVEGFARFCAEHAWTPCLYSVGATLRDHALRLGWNAVQVAEETIVPLPDLAFTGKKWQDIRTALNKADKLGITAEWITFSRAPRGITHQIRAISEDWVADQGLPEMGFTLGGLDELDDDQVRCLIAVDPDRTVHAITSWLPVYDHPPTGDRAATEDPVTDKAVIVGWTLDFMRRRTTAHPHTAHTDTAHPDTATPPAAFPGVMEFLIASAAQQLKAEGAGFISLSGAPLARLDRGTTPSPLQRLLDLTGQALEPVYGFRTLLAFKAKFQPDYQPLYLLYPDPAALPAIGAAITRAYLPGFRSWEAVLDTCRRITAAQRRAGAP